MLTNGEIKIIECFFPLLENAYTTKEIEVKSNYSHERAYTLLMGLVKRDYLSKRKTGKTYLFSVNLKKDFLLPFIHFHTIRNEQFLKSKPIFVKNLLNEFIEKISNDDLISVIVFGSFAKGEERKESDIDILCITRKKYAIEKIALSLVHKYNKKITPIIVLAKDFPNIKKDNPVFYDDLIKSGVILYGLESFYKLVYGKK